MYIYIQYLDILMVCMRAAVVNTPHTAHFLLDCCKLYIIRKDLFTYCTYLKNNNNNNNIPDPVYVFIALLCSAELVSVQGTEGRLYSLLLQSVRISGVCESSGEYFHCARDI